MDKSISARRKAQQLARNGDIVGAVQEIERVLQASEGDPYDFVFRGDLLVRVHRFDEAVFAYEEAIAAYDRVGLYRNAIAICKKVLRTDPTRRRIHGRLGDLYCKEGLASEAVSHFLAFLDCAGDEATGEEFLQTLERVADLAGHRPEATLRIADLFVRAGREERASQILLDIAEQTEASGATEISAELRARARAILPPRSAETPPPATSEAQVEIVAFPVLEPSSVGRPELCPVPDIPPAGPFDASGTESGPSGNGGSGDRRDVVTRAVDAALDDPGVAIDVPRTLAPDLESVPVVATPDPQEAASESTPGSLSDLHARLETAIAERMWTRARDLAKTIHEGYPDDSLALENLVVVSRELGDTLAQVRYLILLGDLKINEEEFEGSLDCFLKVMELDPGNVTARRRLARFRDMNIFGSDRIAEKCKDSVRAIIDTEGGSVSVRSRGGVESGEWMDLSALLQEFREGTASQIDGNDAEAHYDLALSHHEMGLFSEAAEEFGIVLGSKGITAEMEIKAREMRGDCLERLERHREAIGEYRVALDIEGIPEWRRTPLRYRLACALEKVGTVDEARAISHPLRAGTGSLPDARPDLERLGD